MKMSILGLTIGLLATGSAFAQEGPAPVTATDASSAVTAPALEQPVNGKNVHLGKIDVQGAKPLVEALQEIKLAVRRPFDNLPAHFDDMVCRLVDDELGSHITKTLECGTQGWFAMRRNSYMYGNFGTGNASVAVSTLGHPWHSIRELNARQIMVLREILRELPPPGQGLVEVVDDGKAPLEPGR